jgi:hypothetical protein
VRCRVWGVRCEVRGVKTSPLHTLTIKLEVFDGFRLAHLNLGDLQM